MCGCGCVWVCGCVYIITCLCVQAVRLKEKKVASEIIAVSCGTQQSQVHSACVCVCVGVCVCVCVCVGGWV